MRRALIVLLGLVCAALAIAALTYHDQIAALAAEAQRDFQNGLARGLRAIRAGQGGAWAGFLGLCFAYGFVHAVGPGHGKFLVGAWGMARPVGMARLAGITLAASLGQAVTAVALVTIGVALLGLSRQHMTALAERSLAPASLILIGLIGLWLALRGLRRLTRLRSERAARTRAPAPAPAPAGGGHHHPVIACGGQRHRAAHDHAAHHCAAQALDHGHAHDNAAHQSVDDHHSCPPWADNHGGGHRHGHDHPTQHPADDRRHPAPLTNDHGCRHQHLHDHDHPASDSAKGHQPPPRDHDHADDGACPDCGHRHAPTLPEIAAATSPREVAALIAAVAIRPCSGAILLLVLTWQMGILAAGIAGAFAMAAGTASLTIAVALAAVAMRQGAAASLAASPGLRAASGGFEVIAGLVILIAVATGLGVL